MIVGDLAERAASGLDADMGIPVGDGLPPDVMTIEGKGLLSKIRFAWRPADRSIQDRMRAAADAVFLELFADAIVIIDEFYGQLRVPEVNPNGIVVVGSDGRPRWCRDEVTGKPIEKITQLTGQDFDQAILSLQRVLLEVSPQVNALMLEAIYAYHTAKDAHDDAWFGMVEGTQGDRSAHSNRESRQDRYHAHFRYHVYMTAKCFLDEITALVKRLESLSFRLSRGGQ